MKPLISVIIPVYGVEKYLDRCLESVVNQTYKNLQIILVDDGSKDNCPQMCDDWAKKDTRIIVVHKENGGLSSARNAGLDVSNGEYVAFVDSDDYIDESMYEKLYNAIDQAKADISCCGIKRFNDKGVVDLWISDKDKTYNKQNVFDTAYTSYIGWASWNRLYKKELFKKIRFVEGRTREDLEMVFRIYYQIEKMTYINEPLYNYYINDNGIVNKEFSKSNLDMLWACEKSLNLHKEKNNINQENRIKQLYIEYLLEFYKKKTTDEIDDELKKYSFIIKKEGIPKGFKLKFILATKFSKIYKMIT